MDTQPSAGWIVLDIAEDWLCHREWGSRMAVMTTVFGGYGWEIVVDRVKAGAVVPVDLPDGWDSRASNVESLMRCTFSAVVPGRSPASIQTLLNSSRARFVG